MKQNNRTVTESKDEFSPYDLEGSLVDLRNRIDAWISAYGNTARLDWDANFHYAYDPNPSPKFSILVDRPETKEEHDARTAVEAAALLARENREREEFDRLQKKFGAK
jgi:hypothetical protein